jgi:predicted phosphoribosyltransferase/dienelactone hydrolase
MTAPFRDRRDAGRRLGERLGRFAGRPGVLVLGLPRGGVPVAREVARALGAPLDVFVVRKLGVPGQEELAMGAIASGGVRVLNREVVDALGVTDEDIGRATREEAAELYRREALYRAGRPPRDVRGQTVILVDDGLATGSTMRAALAALRRRTPAAIVVAVPVGAAAACAEFDRLADACVCLATPEPFRAVGLWYEDFSQTADAEVREALADSGAAGEEGERMRHEPVERAVNIPCGERRLEGVLGLPETVRGVVAFAHGSGSGRHSPRNRHVARTLQEAGIATLLLDLLGPDEEGDRAKVFDIELLAGRLVAAVSWLGQEESTRGRKLGLFGASTGAGAALVAAAREAASVAAVVSRGGRPDLAGPATLGRVVAPTLLIVGGRDEAVIELNRKALAELTGPRELVLVPDATHLFPEPGALEEVARLAAAWFTRHLAGG